MIVRLLLLGSPRVLYGDKISEIPLERPASLLLYLAVQNDWVSRSRLAFLYRPDAPEATAQSHIRKLVHRAKKYPWAQALEIEASRLRFAVATDVVDFQTAILDQDWASALELYRNPFLEGLELPDASSYGAWLELERETLGLQWHSAATKHIDSLVNANRLIEAQAVLHRVLTYDPLDETSLQTYMQVLRSLGEHHVALKAYDHFKQALAQELSTEPLESTQALADTIHNSLNAHAIQPLADTLSSYNLPEHSTRFIGRESELQQLTEMLQQSDSRLITLLGLGGSGKTRLAIEIAKQSKRFSDGVYFVPLANVNNPDLLISSLAAALDISLKQVKDPKQTIFQFLQSKQLLLILDNFEHLLDAAYLIEEIILKTSSVHIIVTSRVALDLSSEWLLDLQGLAIPPADTTDTTDRFAAVQLFIDRAKRHGTLVLTDHTLVTIAAITRMVDGNPLAIELAASWVRILSTETIHKQLAENLSILSSTRPDLPDRQRSLQVILDTSWQYLSVNEQMALAKLTVFRNPFTLAAAERIANITLATLLSLINRALIKRQQAERYELHELVRQYGFDQLSQRPEQLHAAQEAHSDFFLTTCIKKPLEQKNRLNRQILLFDDICDAWLWLIRGNNWPEIAAVQSKLETMFTSLGRSLQGTQLLGNALNHVKHQAHTPEQQRVLSELLIGLADLYANLGKLEQVKDYLEQSLLLLAQQPDAIKQHSYALTSLGRLNWQLGNYATAQKQLETALGYARRLGDHRQSANILHGLAIIHKTQGQLDPAYRYYQEALESYKDAGETANIVMTMNNLAALLLAQGQTTEARRLLNEGLELARQASAKRSESYLLMTLAGSYYETNQYPESLKRFHESLKTAKEVNDETMIGDCYRMLGKTQLKLGNIQAARQHLGQALTMTQQQATPPRLLACLLAYAELAWLEADYQLTHCLLNYVLHHPATQNDVREESQNLLHHLDAAHTLPVPPPTITALPLEQLVKNLR